MVHGRWRTDQLLWRQAPAEAGQEKEDLAAKLAAAEAEASALRLELAARRAERLGELPKAKAAKSAKRIDGTGYRETMSFGPNKMTGRPDQQADKWGLTESRMFLDKGGLSELLGGPPQEEGAEAVVRRRLLIGLGLTAAAAVLAFLKLPALLTRPSKPLFFYLVPVVQLEATLKSLFSSATDASAVRSRLQAAIGEPGSLKENLLSASALLEGSDSDKATSLSFEILEYLDQADFSKYFRNLGEPSEKQKSEFLKFSTSSIQATLSKLKEFLKLIPSEALDAARLQLPAN
eukprot:SM000019S05094  [mRNA]  locus=s19:932186:935047:+ [translate_table: standard]